MRIVHVVPALFGANGGVVGGAERYALELARHMAEQAPTTLVSFGASKRDETMGRLQVHVIDTPWYVRGQRSNPVAFGPLAAHLRTADVVHCHQQHLLASSMAAMFCRATRRRIFVTDLGGGGWDISAYVSTDRWYHGHLHISQYSRQVFGQAEFDRAQVIYGGVDTGKFCPDTTCQRTNMVLFVGRLLPHKGVDDLIAGLPEGFRLEVIGQPYDQRYFRDLQRMAETKDVVFRHDCDDAALVEAYRRALCIVLPSVYRTMYGEETDVPELLGQTPLEGMACATPAIVTRVASLPEIVVDGVTGFIVPPNSPQAIGERIRELSGNRERAVAMGEAARRHVMANFSWPAVVQRCLRIYQG